MEFEQLIRDRMSVRRYSDRKVEEEKLAKVLEAARLAPTARNLQPFKIYVITSEEGLKKVDEVTPCRYNASTVLLMVGLNDQAYTRGEHNFYEIDSTIVLTHMMLEATNLGLGTLWIGRQDQQQVKEVFGLAENEMPISFMDLGYRADDCPDNPLHTTRKDLNDLVVKL